MPPLVGEVVSKPPKRPPTETFLLNRLSTPSPTEKTPGPPLNRMSPPSLSEMGVAARRGSATTKVRQTATRSIRRIGSLLPDECAMPRAHGRFPCHPEGAAGCPSDAGGGRLPLPCASSHLSCSSRKLS